MLFRRALPEMPDMSKHFDNTAKIINSLEKQINQSEALIAKLDSAYAVIQRLKDENTALRAKIAALHK